MTARRAPTRLGIRLPLAGVVLGTVLTAGACGNQGHDAAEPGGSADGTGATAAEPTSSASAEATHAPPAAGAKEQVTTAGIAAVVAEHLGADNIAAFGYYGDDPGIVDLMVRMRDGNRADNFAVTVYSPKRGGGEFTEMTKCPRGKQAEGDKYMKKFTCHQLPNGTTVTAYLVASGFSDDNTSGQVISGMAGAQDGSVAMAMYESYDRTPPITVTDLDELLSDPRLTWMTDPAINTAGKELKIQKLRG